MGNINCCCIICLNKSKWLGMAHLDDVHFPTSMSSSLSQNLTQWFFFLAPGTGSTRRRFFVGHDLESTHILLLSNIMFERNKPCRSRHRKRFNIWPKCFQIIGSQFTSRLNTVSCPHTNFVQSTKTNCRRAAMILQQS